MVAYKLPSCSYLWSSGKFVMFDYTDKSAYIETRTGFKPYKTEMDDFIFINDEKVHKVLQDGDIRWHEFQKEVMTKFQKMGLIDVGCLTSKQRWAELKAKGQSKMTLESCNWPPDDAQPDPEGEVLIASDPEKDDKDNSDDDSDHNDCFQSSPYVGSQSLPPGSSSLSPPTLVLASPVSVLPQQHHESSPEPTTDEDSDDTSFQPPPQGGI